jgi:hypothetical protein
MARPAVYGLGYLDFKEDIKLICADLKINPGDYYFRFNTTPEGENGSFDDETNTIYVNKWQSPIDIRNTLMHELRHAWQFTTGKVKLYYTKRFRWRYAWKEDNKVVRYKAYNVHTCRSEDEYYNQPHEIDAYDYEDEYDRLFGKE